MGKPTLKSQFVSFLLILNQLNLFQFAASLTAGSFEEARMLKNVEACEWLTGAIHALEVPNLEPAYVDMQAVCVLYLILA